MVHLCLFGFLLFSELFKKRIGGEEEEKKKALEKLPRLIKIKLSNWKTKKMREQQLEKSKKTERVSNNNKKKN